MFCYGGSYIKKKKPQTQIQYLTKKKIITEHGQDRVHTDPHSTW